VIIDTIVQADASAFMASLPDGCVDAIITDPPYLKTDLDFDRAGLDMKVFADMVRVVKPNGYLAVFAPVEMQAEIAKTWKMRFSGAWVKQAGGMRTAAAKKPMNQWELYCVFAHPLHRVSNLTWNQCYDEGEPYRKVKHYTGYIRDGINQIDRSNTDAWTQDGYILLNSGDRRRTDVLYGSSKPGMAHNERTIHPTQKPLRVIDTLIRWLTNPGELVLDPFIGSGTTALAAAKSGRHFIGCDQSAEYAAIALERLRKADPFQDQIVASGIVQRSLFTEAGL